VAEGASGPAEAAGLRAGYAAADITLPAGTEMTGFIARNGPCEGVLDPLEARALVFEDGSGGRAALVTCDLIAVGCHLVARVRRRIAELTGIPEGAVLIHCSHTHSGPETGVKTTIARPNPAYLASLEQRLVAVVVDAARSLAAVRFRAAVGEVPEGLALNRAYRRLGREIEYDHRLTVVRIEQGTGEPFATLVSFGCHPVSLGAAERHASADYVGVLRRALEAAGTGPVLYVNNCCGDVNPVGMEQPGRALAAALGDGLAQVALPLWRAAAPVDAPHPTVRAAQEWVEPIYLPLRTAAEAAEMLERGRRRLADLEPGTTGYRATQITEVEHALRLLRHHYGREAPAALPAEVQALRLGPLAVVGLPGEIFSSIGSAIKAASPVPAPLTLVANLSNDNVGYVADRGAYGVAPYETDIASRYGGHPAAWAPELGERLIEAGLRALAIRRRGGEGGDGRPHLVGPYQVHLQVELPGGR
jgi:neutral ceramidase